MNQPWMTAKIGTVIGKAAETEGSGAPSTSLGQMLRILDAVTSRHAVPIQTEPVPLELDAQLGEEFRGYLLGARVSYKTWLQRMKSPPFVVAPLIAPQGDKPSYLVWPYEQTARMHSLVGKDREMWIETSHLSRGGIEAAARFSGDLSRERGGLPIIWVHSGWGESEDEALSVVRSTGNVSDTGVSSVPFESVQRVLLEPSCQQGAILMAMSRSAVPLARLLGSQGWVAWGEGEPLVAQASGQFGPALVLSVFLDRLGFPQEGAELGQMAVDIERRFIPTIDVIEQILERLKQG